MAIPDYETLKLGVLQYVADGKDHPLRGITAEMSKRFTLTSEEREKLIPWGQSTYIQIRTGWAKTYLKKAGPLAPPRRGLIQITDRGREVLLRKSERIYGDFPHTFSRSVHSSSVFKQN
jgi:restriction system protein